MSLITFLFISHALSHTVLPFVLQGRYTRTLPRHELLLHAPSETTWIDWLLLLYYIPLHLFLLRAASGCVDYLSYLIQHFFHSLILCWNMVLRCRLTTLVVRGNVLLIRLYTWYNYASLLYLVDKVIYTVYSQFPLILIRVLATLHN